MTNDLLETILLLFLVFASSIRLAMSGNDFKKLVSSAKRLVKKILHRVKSFIQSRNSRGPRTALP